MAQAKEDQPQVVASGLEDRTSRRRDVPVVRVFLSSPGDVAEERKLARQLIDNELPKLPHFRERVKLELIAWDDPAAQIPLLATETPQESVTAARPRPGTCDIVIVILWSRMGSPLAENLHKPNGELYLSGTEWEYEDAVNAPEQSRPDVLVYRRTEEPRIGVRDPQKKDKEQQFKRVEAFFAQLRSLKRGVNEYSTPNDFTDRLRQHLQDILYRRLLKPAKTKVALPPRPERFVGREHELSRLVKAICQDTPHPVVVLGGPGMGKSTLCVEAINNDEVITKYDDNRYYINLDGVATADAMLARILDTMDVVSGPNPLSQVLATLSDAPSLLVLDNAELCWWKDTTTTETILSHLSDRSSPHSTFLAALRGAKTPLGVPWSEKIRLLPLSDLDSRKLFLSITGIADCDTDSDLDYILHALDGMPLAIVLMARRAETASLRDLARGWQRQRTKMLKEAEAGGRDLNLEVSVEMSISDPRMGDDAKELLYLLGLLPIGIETDELDKLLPESYDAKDNLVATGIAIRTEHGVRLLGPIREYINANYKPSRHAHRNLVSHFFSLANEAGRIGWTDGRDIFRRLSRNDTTIESFINDELNSPDFYERGGTIAVALSYGRFQIFSGTGTYEILETASKAARMEDNDILEAHCHRLIGSIKRTRSLVSEARQSLERAKAIYKRHSDYLGVAHCLRRLGDTDRDEFNFEAAKARYRSAIRCYAKAERSAGERNGRCTRDSFLEVNRSKEVKGGRADCVFRRGIIEQDSGLRHEHASKEYRKALRVQEAIGNILGQAHCRKRLADTAMAFGRHEEAKSNYTSSRHLYDTVPYYRGLGDCLYSLADLFLIEENTMEAESLYRQASELYIRTSSEHGKANCRGSLADVQMMVLFRFPGRRDMVAVNNIRDSYVELAKTYRSLNDDIGHANCCSGISDVEQLLGNEQKAEDLFVEASEVAQKAFGSALKIDPAIKFDAHFLRRWRR